MMVTGGDSVKTAVEVQTATTTTTYMAEAETGVAAVLV